MSNKKDQFERDFDAFLNDGDAGLSALYAKLPQAEPDAKLDAAVLAMAHRALNPHLVATPSPRRGSAARRHARWLPVFGAAATVVFAVGVAVTMGPQLWTQRGSSTPASVAHDQGVIHVVPIDTPAAAPEPPLSPPPPATAAAAPEPRQDLARSALKPAPPPADAVAKQVATAPQPPAPPPPPAREAPAPPVAAEAPAATLDYQPQRLEAERLPQQSGPAPQAVAPSAPAARNTTEMDAVERKEAIAEGAWQRLHENEAAPVAKSARSDKAASAPGAPATAYAAPAPAAADSAGSLAAAAPKPAANAASAPASSATRSAAPAGGATAANAPAANPFPAPADSAEHPSLAERRARVEAEKKKLEDEEARRAGGVAGTPAAAVTAGKAAPTRNTFEIPAALAAHPQDWVAAMQKLLRDGHGDELRANLDQFRQRYPNYRLPADLDRFARAPR